MSRMDVSKLKSRLQEIVTELGQEGPVSTDAIVKAMRAQYPADIEAASTELQDIAMTRLLGQIASRKPHSTNQMDLFGGYSGLQQLINVEVEEDGHLVKRYKLLAKATVHELDLWLSHVQERSGSRRQRYPGMVKLYRDVSHLVREDGTVEDALQKRMADEAEEASNS